MVNSMTGYGRCEIVTGSPESFIEDPIKKYISSRLNRGKVDVFVSVGSSDSTETEVSVNLPLAKAYAAALLKLSHECPEITNDITTSFIARCPDVLTVRKKPTAEEKILSEVMPAVENALDDFLAMRAAEGERMKEDILTRCQTILSIVEQIEQRAPQIAVEYKAKLTERIKELLNGSDIDEQRIAMETAIFADKIAVDEETVRLRSHFIEMNNVLGKGGPVGRKLDFIIQEMNREANTIGSKITDAELAHKVVDIKSEIEKIREQIQNIE